MIDIRHRKEYFSPSQLKKLFLSVGQLNAYLKKVWSPTSAMDFGTAVHMRLLEPLKFAERYVTIDDSKIVAEIGGKRPTATKKYSEWMTEQLLIHQGQVIIPQSDMDKIELIYDNCSMNGIIDTFFTDGDAEKTIEGIATGYNDKFKALAIVDYDKVDMSVDLKTTSKPLHKFRFDANELGYDIQASLTNSINNKPFVFVVVQTVEPFDIGIFTCSDFFMKRGLDKVNVALSNYESWEDEYTSVVLNFEL